jgi:hypothetical protein
MTFRQPQFILSSYKINWSWRNVIYKIIRKHQIYSLDYPSTYVLVFLVVSFLLVFPPKSYMHSSSPYSCYMTCPSHPSRLDHSNYTWRRVQAMKLLICSFLQSPVTSSLFGPNILLNTLFSNTLSLCYGLWNSLWKGLWHRRLVYLVFNISP